jgi:hypothetical protein
MRYIIGLILVLAGLAATVMSTGPWHFDISVGQGDSIGSSSSITMPSTPVPVSSAVAAPGPTTPDTSTPSVQDPILTYLKSPQRTKRYETVMDKAGALIAKGLMVGKFGKVDKYDDNKNDLRPGYVGYGGIETTPYPHTTFAWVYWRNGQIDYRHPILGLSICYGHDLSTLVQIDSPTGTGDGFWNVSLGQTNGTRETSTPGGPVSGTFYSPQSLVEFQQFDDQALGQFAANMAYWFGSGWNK